MNIFRISHLCFPASLNGYVNTCTKLYFSHLQSIRKSICTESMKLSIPRRSNFRKITATDISFFRAVVGNEGLITKKENLFSFNQDWMRRFTGNSKVALRPKSVQEISSIMSYCNSQSLAVVPQGGNTGLVGGSVPLYDEVILSLSCYNAIESLDDSSGVVITQAGVILQDLDEFVGKKGFRVPLDFGSKRYCQIGGNVATNAGGTRFIRYGSLRSSVLGLEVVLPSGEILDNLTTLRKDNTGYDLKQLMIGSEGTLGIITRIALLCANRTPATEVAMLSISDYEQAIHLIQMARHILAENISAVEFMDHEIISLAEAHIPDFSNPFSELNEKGKEVQEKNPLDRGGIVLVECAGSDITHNRNKMNLFITNAEKVGLFSKFLVARDEKERDSFWKLRECLGNAVRRASDSGGGCLKYDISIPIESFQKCIDIARYRTKDIPGVRIVGWGHIGDGNLHLNVIFDKVAMKDQVSLIIEPWIYEFVAQEKGSISAEHGLGLMKSGAIGYSKSAVSIKIMRSIKHIFDPKGICNPYKVLPER